MLIYIGSPKSRWPRLPQHRLLTRAQRLDGIDRRRGELARIANRCNGPG